MNKTKLSYLFLTAFLFNLQFAWGQKRSNSRYVNPFIGTSGTGHTYPGATTPFGMIQVSPETGNIGWNYCSGYRYEDQSIMGFSHTHLSGTGWMDLGDIRLMPFTGPYTNADIKSTFSHENESASPGYYAVKLNDYNVKVQLTATPHAAFHKYSFSGKSGRLLIDLKHGIVPEKAALETHVVRSALNIEDKNTLSGFVITKGWAGDKHVYFVIRLKEQLASAKWLSSDTLRNQQLVLTFENFKTLTINAKIALSTVSIENARLNLETEMPEWNFDAIKKETSKNWDLHLAGIDLRGKWRDKNIFYTALYHNLIVPNNIADVDGSYRGADGKVYTADNKAYYSTLSLWDTFRATNSLYTILYPNVTNDVVNTMLAHYDVKGFLPIWTLWGHENFCMIANHAIPVIAEAYQKGIRNYDVDKAFRAMKESSTINHKKSDWTTYLKYGYYPSDIVKEEAVSRTLESSYDDWCVSQMARNLGKAEDDKEFARRSAFYRNLFDKSTGFLRGKTSNGEWVSPFDPLKISHAGSGGGDYTEANAWQYSWHAMHDIDGLIALFGGRDRFVKKLDTLFQMDPKVYGPGSTVDVSGLIGQYVQGNEPSHHITYLYTYAGQPWKTQKRLLKLKRPCLTIHPTDYRAMMIADK